MKILLTGCVKRQTLPQDAFPKFFRTLTNAIHGALVHAGHEVDWRQVIPGEDLSRYDCALVGLHTMSALASLPYKYGACYAMAKLPHLSYFEDWQLGSLNNSIVNPDSFWKLIIVDDEKLAAQWQACADEPLVDKWRIKMNIGPPTLMVPCFNWGDPETARRYYRACDKFVGWDPSPWVVDTMPKDIREQWAPDEERDRRWVIASFSNIEDWLEDVGIGTGAWPRDPDICKKVTGANTSIGSRYVHEDRMIAEHYTKSWGIVLPGYRRHNAILGFWRGRYNVAPYTGGVMFTDHEDNYPLGAEGWSHSVRDIENMDNAALRQVCTAQKESLHKHMLSFDDSAAALTKIVEENLWSVA